MVNDYAPAVYCWCRRDGLSCDDAAEISQEILLSIFLKLAGFRKVEAGDTFRGWLRRVTRNRVLDFWRRSARRPKRAEGGGSLYARSLRQSAEASSESLDRRVLELLEATERVRARCKERTWDIFTYYVTDGFTAKETSIAFGVSIGNVHQIRARMISRFREELNAIRQTNFTSKS
jgi:RNA polymerase sigma-70 factor (ECF subfamily)